MKTITIGFSPCPNDTFIFNALIHKRIDTGHYHFEPFLADVEQLNLLAINGKLDITKISIAAFANVASNYIILDSGSALGKGTGPILVSKNNISPDELQLMRIAIPGKNTTANLLLSTFFPAIKNKIEILFSEIENHVIEDKSDAGLLIHEGRFTYHRKGLIKIADLGEIWESHMHTPLPLGCIAAKRSISITERNDISLLIRKSIEYAFQHPQASAIYIRENAREMDADVIARHIALYVNDFSLTLGSEGRDAITFLLNNGMQSGLLPEINLPVFNSEIS